MLTNRWLSTLMSLMTELRAGKTAHSPRSSGTLRARIAPRSIPRSSLPPLTQGKPAVLRTLLAVTTSLALFSGAIAQAAPQIQQWTSANGAQVYFVPAPDLPMVDVRIVFDAGSAKDGELAGLAQLTNGLLSEGAGPLDADQIAERFEGVGARFGASAFRDMAVVSLRSLTDQSLLEPALDTLALVLNEPRFPEDAFEREVNRTLIGLRAEQQDPGSVVSKAFYRAVYGSHPYAAPSNGTEESLKVLKRADAQAFHQRYYVAKNAVVAIVGAVDRQGAEAIVKRALGKLPAGSAAAATPAVAPLTEGTVTRLPHPSEQTHILLGQPGITRDDPDYFALYVGNHVLGGSGLVSRVSDEIREKRGLSYSAYSYFMPMRAAGPFTAGLQTRNDQAEEALEVLRLTLQDYIANGPTEKELTAAKKNISGGFALRVDSNSKIVENLAMIGFYDLPLDYLDTFISKVEAVDAEQVRDAFQRRLDPNHMATVIVGGSVPAATP